MQSLKRIAVICAATVILAGCDGGGKGGGSSSGGTPPLAVAAHDPGPTQKIHLKLTSGGWIVKVNGGPDKKPNDAISDIPTGAGPTLFVVSIQGGTQATFRNANPLSVWVGDKSSPPGPSVGTLPDQIIGPFVNQNRTVLAFYDLNRGNELTINYALYFNEPTVPMLDPIIENGGGSWLN